MKSPTFPEILNDPHGTLLAYVHAFFSAHPLVIITGMHITTSRDFYGGDALAYATALAQAGYTEHDRHGKPLATVGQYEELDVSQLLEVCSELYNYTLTL